jgi:homoserine O-acetyltransferase/O-succinyltransferase
MGLEPTYEGDLRLDSFRLECGVELRPAVVHYAVFGQLNAERNNAVLVCHALSGSARVADWWGELFVERTATSRQQAGAGGQTRPILDLKTDCVIGVNVLGSCYGSTGPTSVNPVTGRVWGPEFPLVAVRDSVRAEAAVLDHLGVKRLRAVIGASIGGMQALEWAIQYPERVERCIAIGATRLGAMALAQNHLQRQAIMLDPEFQGGWYGLNQGSDAVEQSLGDHPRTHTSVPGAESRPARTGKGGTELRNHSAAGPKRGIALARAIAMCTYKATELFDERYGRRLNRNGEDPYAAKDGRFDVAGYLDYQGEIFVRRFDANTYITITKMMDTFDFARGFASDDDALRRIKASVLLVGISSDWLFPAADVRRLGVELTAAGVECEYDEIVSGHGHDAFLAEPEKLFPLLERALGIVDCRAQIAD